MSWIWISDKEYPDYQNNFYNVNAVSAETISGYRYGVAEFRKLFEFDTEISKISFRTSADSFYHLYINGELYETGPACSGGDFLCRRKYPYHYANVSETDVNGKAFELFAEVKLLPEVLTEYSRGHGGFYCEIAFTDVNGKVYNYSTNESWQSRLNASYSAERTFDSSKDIYKWSDAVTTEDIWNLKDSYIPTLSLNRVFEKEYILKPGENLKEHIELDKIYGIIPVAISSGSCNGSFVSTELKGQPEMKESFRFAGSGRYMSFRMHSLGEAELDVVNQDNKDITFTIILIAPWYRITQEGNFECSDPELNDVYNVCKHTLKICRQSIHLDSTKHQEHLACTGDYYIETLMGFYCFGDMKLSEFDVMRTADWLAENEGVMFHTTYSLIWVQMLRDVYYITGNTELLAYCRNALDILLDRFRTYKGDTGLIETPHDYMFVDWTVVDGYSMHHPPKALGQTVLNMFYYKALTTAAELYNRLNDFSNSESCSKESTELKTAINNELYDRDMKLYFDGKNDITGSNGWLPENSEKRYYTKYPNILACAYGVADKETSAEILERIMNDETLQDIQPYFTHYLLYALRENNLIEKYAFGIFDRWKPVVKSCSKGLAEGWIAPEPNYSFDHSHAWGGTVAYFMPSVISGLKIIEPGMKKISLNPKLYGLDYANLKISTKYGDIRISIDKDKTDISSPEEIKIDLITEK